MRVLIVSQRLPPDHYSGAPRQALELSRALRALGCEVSILTSRFRAEHASGDAVIDGIPVHRLANAIGEPWLAPARAVLAAKYAAMHAPRFDVVHGHALSATVLGALAGAKSARVPVVLKQSLGGESGDLAKLQRSIAGRGLMRAVASADRLLAISEAIARELEAAGVPREKILRVRNGVDLARFRPPRDEEEKMELRRELGLPAGPIAAFVGQLVERKGLRPLLEAWRSLRAAAKALAGAGEVDPVLSSGLEASAFLLVIAGDGPLRELVAAEAADPRSGARVLGARDDVDRLLRAADAFVLPSHAEGLANATLEALATDLPVVIGPAALPADVSLPSDAGAIVDPSNPQAIAAALIDALTQPRSPGTRRRLAEPFDLRAVAEEHLRIYREVIAQ